MSLKVGELWTSIGGDDRPLEKTLAESRRKVQRAAGQMERDGVVPIDADTKPAEQALRDAHGRLVAQARKTGGDAGVEMGDGMAASLKGKMGNLSAIAATGLAGLAAGALGAFDASDQRRRGSGILDSQIGTAGTPFAGGANEAAKNLHRTGGAASMEEAQAAVGALASMIGGLGEVSDTVFRDQAAQALAVANTLGVDVNQAVLAASQLISNGLAKDAGEAFDLMQAGSNAGANRFGDMTDTIIEYSKDWRQLGITADKALAMMATGQKEGARNSDVLADAHKEFYIEVGSGSEKARVALGQLGLDTNQIIADIAGGGSKAEAAYELVRSKVATLSTETQNAVGPGLWGTKWEDAGGRAVLAMQPMTAQLDQVDGAAKRAMDAQKLTGWKLAWETNIAGPFNDWMDELAVAGEKYGARGMFVHIFGEANVADWDRGFDDLARGWGVVIDKATWFKDEVLDPIIGSLQTLLGLAQNITSNELWKQATGPGGQVLGEGLASPGNWMGPVGKMLGFDNGGTVPGPIGSPQVILAHGGERVTPSHKTMNMGGINITVNDRSGNSRATAREVSRELRTIQRERGG